VDYLFVFVWFFCLVVSDVNLGDLYKLLESVDTILIASIDRQVVYSISTLNDIDALNKVLKVRARGAYNFIMKTDVNIQLFKDGFKVFSIQMLSFYSLNCSLWENDASILEPLSWSK